MGESTPITAGSASQMLETDPETTTAPPVLSRLRGIVLLAGSVRESSFTRVIGRPMLDLPVGNGKTLLDHWCDHAANLAGAGAEGIQLRVLTDRGSPLPTSGKNAEGVKLAIEYDRNEFRGTGGVLHDLSAEYDPDDVLLVANANQVVPDGFPHLVSALAGRMGDAALLAGPGGEALGIHMFSARVLRSIRGVGFVDLKEQALPRLTGEFDIRVVSAREPRVLPVRGAEGYLSALRVLHARDSAGMLADPFAEEWFKTFGIVEEGATVHPTAVVHDSVVLSGATVGAGAVLVRCLVGPSGRINANAVLADRLLGDQGRRRPGA